ncbi:hypothetical protein ACSBR1_018917 [Camellia fascicularis]
MGSTELWGLATARGYSNFHEHYTCCIWRPVDFLETFYHVIRMENIPSEIPIPDVDACFVVDFEWNLIILELFETIYCHHHKKKIIKEEEEKEEEELEGPSTRGGGASIGDGGGGRAATIGRAICDELRRSAELRRSDELQRSARRSAEAEGPLSLSIPSSPPLSLVLSSSLFSPSLSLTAFDGCCPDCKFPGDDCRLIWGACNHAFLLHCVLKWVNSQTPQAQCPMCCGEWQFKG